MKMKKLAFICWVVLLSVSSCMEQPFGDDGSAERIDTIPMMVMQIQKCSRLYSAEYQLHKIITHNDSRKLKGSILTQGFNIDLPIGKRKIAIPIEATVKAYIDFADFSEKNVSRRGDKIEIVLPDPKVVITSTRINHEEVKQYVAFLRRNFSDEELTAYEHEGREAIVQELPQLGIVEMARQSAASMLIPMIEQMGFAEGDVKITFRKNYSINDFKTLLDNTLENGNKEKQK